MPEAVSDVQTVTSENRAEFMAARIPQAAPPPAAEAQGPAATPTDAPAPPEGAAPAPGPAEPPADPAADPPKHKRGIETRFSELTQQRDAAAARAEAAERRAAEAEAKLNPPKPAEAAADPAKPPAKPKPADFTDAFEYAEKLAEWSAGEALRQRDAADAAKQAEKQADDVRKAWVKRAAEVEKVHPDYKEVLAASDLKVSDQVRDALMESDHGPSILYELAQDADLVERLSKMTVTGALRTIGRMEAKFESGAPSPAPAPTPPAPAPRPKPPEPITPIRTGEGGSDPEAKYKAHPDVVFVGGSIAR